MNSWTSSHLSLFFFGFHPSKMLDSNHTPYQLCVFLGFLGSAKTMLRSKLLAVMKPVPCASSAASRGPHPGITYCWWQPEIRRKNQLMIDSLSHFLQGFSTIQTVVAWGFPNHQQYHQNGKRHYLWCFKSTCVSQKHDHLHAKRNLTTSLKSFFFPQLRWGLSSGEQNALDVPIARSIWSDGNHVNTGVDHAEFLLFLVFSVFLSHTNHQTRPSTCIILYLATFEIKNVVILLTGGCLGRI